MSRYGRDDSSDEPVEIELYCHAATMKARLLSDDGKESSAVWTPRSQILNDGDVKRDEFTIVKLKRWIAEKNQFI